MLMNNIYEQSLKSVQLDILKCFIGICKKHNLRYFLLGGSALGAIRHQGYIPWDDDIDVGLPRNDYMKFLQIAQSEMPKNYFLQTTETDPLYPLNFAKIRNSETTFIEKTISHLKINHGVYIDIFPLDGFPSKKLKQMNTMFKISLYKRSIFNVFNIEKKGLGIKENLKLSVVTFLFSNPYETLKKQDKLFKTFSYEKSDLVANYSGAWAEKEIVPKTFFGNGTRAFFENIEVCVPEKYDSYLKHIYGDYMTPPPEEKRVGHHYCTVIDLDKSYLEYI